MADWVLKVKQNTFVRNVIIVASGTAAAQLITLILTPIITRLYGPEAIGLLGTFTSIVSIMMPIAALTYPIAIVLAKDDEEARGLVRVSLGITVSVSLVVALVIILVTEPLAHILNLGDFGYVLFIIPIYILISGLLQVAEQWLIRAKRFNATAKATIAHSVMVNGSKVAAGFILPIGGVLIVLTVIGQMFKAFMMAAWSKGIFQRDRGLLVNRAAYLHLMKKYKDFPLFRTPQIFLNSLSQGLPTLTLAILFGPASAGFYTLAKNILSVPSQLIAKSVGDVFYPRISEAAKQGENISKLLAKATVTLLLIGLLPFGTIVAFGPQLFSLIFGENWHVAGQYASWMALWIYAAFLNRPAVSAIPVIGMQGTFLLYEIVSTLVRIGALFVGFAMFQSDFHSIVLFSLSSVVLNISLILFTIQKSKAFHDKVRWREDGNHE